ncbi:MAG TPA: discoidin domain-containing protein [Candidatus Angelobacter sp.]|jgi:hypothetical protein
MRQHSLFIFIICFSQLLFSQEFRSTTAVNAQSQNISLDLSSVSNLNGASITIRNSSGSWITLPQISNPATPWPYNIEAIRKQLPPTNSDQEFAIATWQFVVKHTFHYCSAGTVTTASKNSLTDPALILNSFGFGCCDQKDRILAWIWQQFGYQTRLAAMDFHTVAEIFYNNAWHMFDPDHQVYYFLSDGVTVAAIADILANPNIVVQQADANGLDGAGWSAAVMAQLYAQNAPTLRYFTSGYLTHQGLSVALHPNESLTIFSDNAVGAGQHYDPGDPFTFRSVGTGEFDWDLSFGDIGWRNWAYSSTNVDSILDATGAKYLQNLTSTPGEIVYKESSMFPVLALSVSAQMIANTNGSLWAAFSADGVNWSSPAFVAPTTNVSGFQAAIDFTNLASGQYTYFIKIYLVGNVQVHRLRISPVVQTAKWIFPSLIAGSINQLTYSDSSKAAQARRLQVTVKVSLASPQIQGLQAESLVPENSTFSLARDYGAANLVDGNPDSLAYPGNTHIDYVIHLGGPHIVSGASIDWGNFGSDPRYVKSWTLMGRNGTQDWQTLASGGFPGASTMNISANSVASDLRIVAEGVNNVGIYDVRVFGNDVPPIPSSNLTVFSNIPEDPIYSVAAGYTAANLIDGNPASLAYPSNNHLDYQVSLGTPTHLSAATLTWGIFGSNDIYMSNWMLLGRNGSDQAWSILAQGGYPNSTASTIAIDAIATDLRIMATSSQNSIGIYELQLFAIPATMPVLTNVTAIGNVLEFPGLRGYGIAGNLVDGDDNSAAFPEGPSVDYTLDPGQTRYIDSLHVVWGQFGTVPAYVNSWQIFGLPPGPGATWELVARGGFPNAGQTNVPVKKQYRKMRIAAESLLNAIGIYEVQLLGQ